MPVESRGFRRAPIAICALLALTACGGEDPPAAAVSPTPAPTQSPAPAPVPVPAPPAGGPPPLASNACRAFPDAISGAASGNLSASVTNNAARPLTFSVVTQPTSGSLSLAGSGAFNYMPTTNARGYADNFVYRVTDDLGNVSQATAKVVYGKRRIMPLGDSITFGVETLDSVNGDGPRPGEAIAYRKRLQEFLTAGGYAFDFVGGVSSGSAAGISDADHEGHSGFTTSDIDSSINGWISAARPDVVLLHIGTNDHSANVSAVDAMLGKISAFATNSANPPVTLLAARIIDQRPDSPLVNMVQPFNANLTQLVTTRYSGAGNTNSRLGVSIVDMFSAIDPVADLTPLAQDIVGLHPNTSGYDKMARVWFDALVLQNAIVRCP